MVFRLDSVRSILAISTKSSLLHAHSWTAASKAGVALTPWPRITSNDSPFLKCGVNAQRGDFETVDDWLEAVWQILNREWKLESKTPDVMLTDFPPEEARAFAERHSLPVVRVDETFDVDEESPLVTASLGFFEERPKATVFQSYSRERDTICFVLRNFPLRLQRPQKWTLVEPGWGIGPTEALIVVKQSLAGGAIPPAMTIAQAAALISEYPTPRKREEIKAVVPAGFEIDFQRWRAMRNKKDVCMSCGILFCPHRFFPYYHTSHPAKAPRNFKCSECKQRDILTGVRYPRSTRLTERAAQEMLERYLP
jgi:hypothetical protein